MEIYLNDFGLEWKHGKDDKNQKDYYDELVRAYENALRFRLHDLEVDPNDLPKPYVEVVAMGKNGGIKVAYLSVDQFDGAVWLDKANKKTNVVKWHYTFFDEYV